MIESQGPSRLDSWKSIAAYLNRNVRTVIRWEQQRGLPVHRLPGDARSAVYAYRTEIDAWLKSQNKSDLPLSPGNHASENALLDGSLPDRSRMGEKGWVRASVCAVAILALLLGGYHLLHPSAGQAAMATFTPNTLQAWDDHHHLVWEYRFAEPLAATGLRPPTGSETHDRLEYSTFDRASVHDLYGDGKQEVLAIALFHGGGALDDLPRQVLFCFSSTGKLLWRYEPQTILTFGERSYGAPWALRDLIVSDEPGRKTLWVNVVDYVWGKAFVVRLDADGHSAIQFVNSGEIAVLARFHTSHGAMLWIGGFNDEYDTASVAILRDISASAVSPQTPGTRFVCRNCDPGDPFVYLVLPRYDMGRALHNPNNKVFDITSSTTGIEVMQSEISDADKVLYDFSNDDDPRALRVNYSSSFWPNHLELERQGKLDHPLEKCPDKLHPPPIRMYKDGAWYEITLNKPF